jgi:small subunit ribosomal protein S9
MFVMDPNAGDQMLNAETGVGLSKTMPTNANYFSGDPIREQGLQEVEKVYEMYKHLPQAPRSVWPIRDWDSVGFPHMMLKDQFTPDELSDYRGGNKGGAYVQRQIRKLAKELNKIHPVLQPVELKSWLDHVAPMRRAGEAGVRQVRRLDKYQRSKGHARRKEAKAKVTVLPGEGLLYVNGKPLTDYFKRTKDVENVIWPLQALGVLGQYNVWVSTFGGGTTGKFPPSTLHRFRGLMTKGNRRRSRLLLHGHYWRTTSLVK